MDRVRSELKKKFLHLLRTYSDQDGLLIVNHEALADLLVGEVVAPRKTDLQTVLEMFCRAGLMKAADRSRADDGSHVVTLGILKNLSVPDLTVSLKFRGEGEELFQVLVGGGSLNKDCLLTERGS